MELSTYPYLNLWTQNIKRAVLSVKMSGFLENNVIVPEADDIYILSEKIVFNQNVSM